MNSLIILGSAHSIPDKNHGNTHMLVASPSQSVLIDCGGDVVQRLQNIDFSYENLSDIILTHFHPDHVSGAPLLLMTMWLMGRRKPINIIGNQHTISRIKTLMDLYGWQDWPDFYPLSFIEVQNTNMSKIIDGSDLRIFASPVSHMIPTIGLRVEFTQSGTAFAYTADSEPCQQIIELAENVDILLHEATGDSPGHSSPRQAGQSAALAGAKALCLIHYAARGEDIITLLHEARQFFQGQVRAAEDMMVVNFN
jgi:ribonuclease Z